ncbi:hypothetical protein Tco_0946836 [Tanacetum coccineum]
MLLIKLMILDCKKTLTCGEHNTTKLLSNGKNLSHYGSDALAEDLFNTFDQYLIDELSEVQNVFHQMEQAVEQHHLESKTFEVKMNQVLNENERLLEQVISKDIVNIIVNSSMDNAYENVHECEKCLKLETELQKDFIEKEIYDKLFKSYTTLEKHCISLEVDTQLNQEIFQRDNSVSNQSAPSFDQLFELNELKAQSQEKDTVIKKLKERIKSLSGKINEDKIKEALKNDLRNLKGKALADNAVTKHTIDPEMLKIDVEYLNPRFLNNRSAHSDYLKHTQEEAAILREIVEQGKSQNPLNTSLDSAYKYTKQIQELLVIIGQTCPSFNNSRVKPSTSTSRSQPSGNTKKYKIQQTPSSTQKNKVEGHPRKVNSSLKNKDCVVAPKGTANVITTTTKVPLRKPTALENETPKPVVTLVYSRKPRRSKTNVPVSKSKVLKYVSANKKEPSQSWGSIVSDVPSSSLAECRLSKLLSGTIKFRNDHVAKILGYGDYQIRNVTNQGFAT